MASEKSCAYRGLMALVAASEDGIHGRIRAQKVAYIAGLLGASDFSTMKFQYHSFGPYSRQMSDCLQFLVAAGFVTEEQKPFKGEQIKYIYRLTEQGRAWIAQNTPDDFDLLQRIVTISTNADVSALELAATAEFLQHVDKINDRLVAFHAAIERRPQCNGFMDEAIGLLSSLGLDQSRTESGFAKNTQD